MTNNIQSVCKYLCNMSYCIQMYDSLFFESTLKTDFQDIWNQSLASVLELDGNVMNLRTKTLYGYNFGECFETTTPA